MQLMEVNVDRLKELRETRAMSLRELSQEAGVGYSTIYRLENGKNSAHAGTVRKLAEALGVSPGELRAGEPDKSEVEKSGVEVGNPDSDYVYRAEIIRFTGREIDHYERSNVHFHLYECPKGYRVYEVDEEAVEKRLEPTDYGNYGELFTAEDIAEHYPTFANSVGIWPVRDID